MNIKELFDRGVSLMKQHEDLEKEYENKTKGNVHKSRSSYLQNRFKDTNNKVKVYGEKDLVKYIFIGGNNKKYSITLDTNDIKDEKELILLLNIKFKTDVIGIVSSEIITLGILNKI